MTITIRTLKEVCPEEYELLHDMCIGLYLHGECYAFAIALHQGLGWPIVGLMRNEKVAEHVGVRDPDGGIRDVRGRLTEAEFASPFPSSTGEDLALRKVTAEELYAIRPIKRIDRARRMAELLWPELPWKEKFGDKVMAFATELEALSRKHGLWIRAPLPATQPIIGVEYGDEIGYVLGATLTANDFTLDRVLK